MNRLKKKAWKELTVVFGIIVFISIPCVLQLSKQNAQGWGWLVICIIISGPMILNGYLSEVKNLKQFDEREQTILRKSFSVWAGYFPSTCLFFLLLYFSSSAAVNGSGGMDAGHGFKRYRCGSMRPVVRYSIAMCRGRR